MIQCLLLSLTLLHAIYIEILCLAGSVPNKTPYKIFSIKAKIVLKSDSISSSLFLDLFFLPHQWNSSPLFNHVFVVDRCHSQMETKETFAGGGHVLQPLHSIEASKGRFLKTFATDWFLTEAKFSKTFSHDANILQKTFRAKSWYFCFHSRKSAFIHSFMLISLLTIELTFQGVAWSVRWGRWMRANSLHGLA